MIQDTGGTDSGAVNYSLGLYERNIVWKIANYLKTYLEEYEDIEVYMTCPTLKTTGDSLSREERADIMKAYDADLAVSLHINSSSNTNLTGATAYVTALPKYKTEMTKLANLFLTNLNKLGIANDGVKTRGTESNDGYYSDGTPLDYYGIIRYPTLNNVPIVLLEHCYMSNSSDCKFIDSDDDLKKLAQADCAAIVSYLGLTKKSSTTTTTTNTTNTANTTNTTNNTTTNSATTNTTNTTNTISTNTATTEISFQNITTKDGYITNITAGTTAKEVKNKITTKYTVTITDKDGEKLNDTDVIPNCSKVVITDDNKKQVAEYIIIIYGDLDCNGVINSVDLLVLQRHILGISKLDSDVLKAGNISKDGTSPTSVDLLKIQRHILGISSIS